jgi:hypothetical protein
MSEEDMRMCFAMFAMLKVSWDRGEEESDARDCWKIADEMLRARHLEQDEGIASIRKRQYKRKNVP